MYLYPYSLQQILIPMKTIFRSTTLLGLTCLGMTLYAQDQPATSLQNLWQKVEHNYPGLQAQTALVTSMANTQNAIRNQALPQLKIQAQNTYGTFEGSNGAFFPQAGFFNVSGTPYSLEGSNQAFHTFGSAVIEWEIFAFGKQNQDNKAALAQYNQSLAQKELYAVELKKELSLRHIKNLYANTTYDWISKNVQRLEAIKQISSGLALAGLRPAADSLLAHSSYLQAVGQQIFWIGAKQATHLAVAELVGESLPTIDANHLAKFLTPALFEKEQMHLLKESDHPALQQFQEETSFFEHRSKSIASAALPSIKLLGGYSIRGTGIQAPSVSNSWNDGFSNSADNYLLGVGLTWNFSSLFTNQYKKRAFHQQAENATQKYKAYQQALHTNIEANHIQLYAQTEQLKQTHQAVEQATQAYDMYMARYQNGLIALSELLQIQHLLEQAEKTHIEATQYYWLQLVTMASFTTHFDFLFTNL